MSNDPDPAAASQPAKAKQLARRLARNLATVAAVTAIFAFKAIETGADAHPEATEPVAIAVAR